MEHTVLGEYFPVSIYWKRENIFKSEFPSAEKHSKPLSVVKKEEPWLFWSSPCLSHIITASTLVILKATTVTSDTIFTKANNLTWWRGWVQHWNDRYWWRSTLLMNLIIAVMAEYTIFYQKAQSGPCLSVFVPSFLFHRSVTQDACDKQKQPLLAKRWFLQHSMGFLYCDLQSHG